MTANVIIKQVLLRRGNTAATSTYVGPVGEAVVDTDLKTLRVQDGHTAGGTLLATANSVTNVSTGISSINSNVAAANVAITALQSNAAVQAQAIISLQTTTGNIGNSIVTANTAMKSYVDTQDAALRANITAANLVIADLWANAASQDYHIGVLYGNAVTQFYNLLNLNSNATIQGEQIDYLFGNVAQHDLRLIALESEDIYQENFLGNLLANSAAQGVEIQGLWANAAAQSVALNIITGDTTAIWANAAVQENEISGLRANIIAANAAMISANTNLKNYTDYKIGSRTGEITFSGRTISANIVGNVSGIDIAPETRFASFVGFNNSDPQHWVDIGDGLSENVNQNTGSLGIGFNNGVDTLQGHAILTWDWWDTTLTTGTHNDGTGTHSRLVVINNDNFDKPYISFDNATGNVVVGNVTADITHSNVGHFSGNTYSSYVIFNNDVRYSNGTPYMSGISARLDAANLVMNVTVNNAITTSNSYTDTKVANLVNGAPAILDTLSEISSSLGNNASLSTTLLNLISSTDSNVAAANVKINSLIVDTLILEANARLQGEQLNTLTANAVTQDSQLNSLVANAAIQENKISDLRSNITAANATIITNLAYTNQLNVEMSANVTAANAATVTANVAMKGYVDSHIDLALGNIAIQDTTITTKAGASSQTIIVDAGSEIVLRDFTGIRNPNPGYWLHIGDAFDETGLAHTGQLAIDYSDGMSNGSASLGQHGSVVFDYLWWSNVGGGHGNYNVTGGPSRRFGLLKDGSYPQFTNEQFTPYFTVDLDTKIFRVNSLQSGTSILAANVYSTGNIHALGNYTGNVRTDGYFFANGAPLVIPPLVKTGNAAPTAEQGATEGALWWNNEDGRSYIKYSNNWVEFSPTVLPPISRYVGNVVFYHHNISNVGNITPHTTLTYNIGKDDFRWKGFYVDTIDTTGNVFMGSNLSVAGNVNTALDNNVTGNVNVTTDVNVNNNVNVTGNVNVTTDVNVDTDINVLGNAVVGKSIVAKGEVNVTTGNINAAANVNVSGSTNVTADVNVTGNVNVASNTNIASNLNVVKNAVVNGNVQVVLNHTVGGNLQVNGYVSHISNVVPLSTSTYSIGSTVLRWKDLYVGAIDTTGNVSIGGNLFVYGNTTQVSTQSLIIDDSIIYMANNNPGSSIDIGIAGNFNDGVYQHTGFVRDASDNTWKLFSNVIPEPTNTVNFTDAKYDNIRVGNIASPTVTDLYANIITANTAVVSYVNTLNTSMLANVDAANTAIITANSGMKSYVLDLTNSLSNRVDAANAAIVTANSAVVSYVNSLNSGMLANVAAANSAIVTANTALKNYTDTQLGTKANSASPTFTGTTTIATLSVSGNATISQNAIIQGNLQVQGTTTTINQTSLTLTDKFITMANGSPNASAANNSGLFVYGANANVLYKSANDSWTFNKPLYFDSNVVWHAGNDGAGSGLDADTLDGLHASSFVQSGVAATGVIIPTTGAGTAGIIWPTLADGDYGYIKYYDASSDQTVLEIGVYCDDPPDPVPGDIIKLTSVQGIHTNGPLVINKGTTETFTGLSGSSGVVAHDCSAGTIFYHTSLAGNFTVNATNLKCDSGYTATVTIVISQGGVSYIPNAFQIGGVAQTINWQGGSAPSGNANKKDIVSFSILNSSGTYIVFGQLVSFG